MNCNKVDDYKHLLPMAHSLWSLQEIIAWGDWARTKKSN
jgi:hypothetical protein